MYHVVWVHEGVVKYKSRISVSIPRLYLVFRHRSIVLLKMFYRKKIHRYIGLTKSLSKYRSNEGKSVKILKCGISEILRGKFGFKKVCHYLPSMSLPTEGL